MKKLFFSILFAAVFAISAADAPRVSRTLMVTVEKHLDERLRRMWNDNPMAILGATRGVYLPGYGIVLTAEMNLVTANISMMSPNPSDAEKVELRKRKVERVPALKAALKEALVAAAVSLDQVPGTDKVTIAVILPRYTWEELTGVPLQVVAEGTRSQLIAAQKAGPTAIDQAVKISETN